MCGALDGTDDPQVTTTAAEDWIESNLNSFVVRVWIFVQQYLRIHDDAIHAKGALRRLLFDKCFSKRMQAVPQPFEGSDGFVFHGSKRCYAREDCFSIHDDRTCPALAETAAEFRAVKSKRMEHVEQWSACIQIYGLGFAVQDEFGSHVVVPEISQSSGSFVMQLVHQRFVSF